MTDNHKPKLALGYGRLSLVRTEQDRNSPRRQQSIIEEWAAKNGYEVEFFVDARGHQSGRSERRKGWRDFLQRLAETKPSIIVFESVSRPARRMKLLVNIVDDALQRGIEVLFLRDNIHLRRPDDKQLLEFHIRAMLAQEESDENRRRVLWNIQHVRENSGFWGALPFGTIRDENKKLTPDPAGAWRNPETGEFSTVERSGWEWRGYHASLTRLYEILADGVPPGRAAVQMNAEGWPYASATDRVPRQWDYYSVRSVAANWQLYAGHLTEGRTDTAIDPPVIQPNAWPPILPVLLCETVAARIHERRSGPMPSKPGRPVESELGGILFCGACGARLNHNLAFRTHKDRTYTYRNYTHRGPKCSNMPFGFDADHLEKQARELLQVAIGPIEQAAGEQYARQMESTDDVTAGKIAELERLDQTRRRMLEMNWEGILTDDEDQAVLRRKLAENDGRRRELRAEIAAVRPQTSLSSIAERLRDLQAVLERADEGDRAPLRDVYRAVVEHFRVVDKTGTLFPVFAEEVREVLEQEETEPQ